MKIINQHGIKKKDYFMIYDLNVPWTAEDETSLVLRLSSLKKRIMLFLMKSNDLVGYQAIAVNHKVDGKLPKARFSFATIRGKLRSDMNLRLYTRITLVLSDPQQNYGINSGNEIIRSYDILAVQPETEKAFISACTSLDIDLISLDLSVRLPFPIKAGYIRQAISKGIAFEILYAPIVADATARRNAIGNARLLLRLALGKRGLLISGGADAAWQLRAPADVMNLAGLLGIASHLRENCLTIVPEALFMRAASRKHAYRSTICVMPLIDNKKEEKKAVHTDMLEDYIELK